MGHQIHPDPMRLTEFAPAISPQNKQAAMRLASSAPPSGYAPPATATPWKAGRFTGSDFALQSDGTLRCPAGSALIAHEQRREADGSLRVVYGASIRNCRPCSLRERCQWNGNTTKKPRQVSVLLHPLTVGPAPLLWRDWSRRKHRRACMHLLRHQRLEVSVKPLVAVSLLHAHELLSRAERSHTRLTWAQRLARNAGPEASGSITIKLFGVPNDLATWLGL